MPSADSLWYKDAIFYELPVKAFQDANGDGVGDFRGIVERLDYVQELGVDCIWLLPFYPSPLRDDGYDIADYYSVHPSYGTLDDFQRLLDEAHQRGLKVIADLVLNHTSDQHPWFQRARRAPKGSPERDFYVWSDSDEIYRDARIIFTDTEPSNWTWDPVAGQYYWHRFFAHQPDLNWDNPEVKRKMFEVMEYWMERGLDGFRADAVPYLIEREGTICENLPETHEILKEFRAVMQRKHPDKILLAEANQWPDDVRPYFGEGDEFHMAFHFPLMPRIFMAVRQGIRTPIVEIIQRTPPIPDDCQWCMFLRNHDELTLEMVTDEERDYMYREYAADPRMRLNLGIRRRLAPLMDNDRRKIELLNSILFTMPGSPIIYYGDEIGMGDNIFLGDRDGVRTPMQWSPDRNAGFSRAEPSRLFLPVITDSVYGYQAINVEAQQKSPFSLLNWMKRLVQVRKQHPAFGRGSIEFLDPENPHVLAYIREYEEDTILVVNNLSGAAQAVRLDLSRFAGRCPVELLGQTEFLAIDATPYALTLGPYGFFWFGMHPAGAERDARHAQPLREWAEQDTAIFDNVESIRTLISALPHDWLLRQRWFRGKARDLAGVELCDHAILRLEDSPPTLLVIVKVSYAQGEPDLYLLTLTPRQPAPNEEPVVTLSTASAEYPLYGALVDEPSALALLQAIDAEREVTSAMGVLRGHRTSAFPAEVPKSTPVRRVGGEQSNTSVIYGDRLILKAFRKLEDGLNPDLEVSRFLVEHTDFRSFPALLGWIDYEQRAGMQASLAGLFEFVPNVGDAWSYTLKSLSRFYGPASRSAADPASVSGRESLRRMAAGYFEAARELGRTTGELHAALASAPDSLPDFAPEPITTADTERWAAAIHVYVGTILEEVGRRLETMPGAFPQSVQNSLAGVVRASADLSRHTAALGILAEAGLKKTRFHGDYHLGQVLRSREGKWVVLDFEGEPARPLAERRLKQSPLRDVAGMLRSFNYAAHVAFKEYDTNDLRVRTTLERWAEAWEEAVRGNFLAGYREAALGAGIIPEGEAELRRVLAVFELEKAVYELGYEMNNRPDWIWVPVRGIQAIVGGEG